MTDPTAPEAMPFSAVPVPLCVDAAGLAMMLDVSERQIARLDSGGKLPTPLALGRCKRWSLQEVKAWVAAGAPERRRWMAMRKDEARS